MKKVFLKSLLGMVILSALVSFTSCKKCGTCTYTVSGQGKIVSQEYCGDEWTTFRDRTMAGNSEAVCTEN